MPSIKQLERRIERLKRRGAKEPAVIFFHKLDGDAWELTAQLWDGRPGSYNPDTDCYVMTCDTLADAQAVADKIIDRCGGNPPIIYDPGLEP